jgi:solute:Na+ symporter, SSS family
MNTYLIVILSYFVFVTLISVLTKKVASRSSADFLIAGRNLGTITCAVVVAAEWLGGMSTIGVSERAFTTGTLQPILYNLSTAAGMVIIGFTVARHYREKNVHTVSEMLNTLFGHQARTYSAIAFLIAYITLAFVQLQTCASVMAPLFGIDWIWAVFIASILITIYTYIGGMHALAITGIMHVITMFAGIGIALYIGLDKINGFGSLTAKLLALGSPTNWHNPFSAGFSQAFSLLLGGVLGGMAGQASIQPIFAARNAKIAKNAAIMSAFIVAPFGIMVAILGLIGKTGYFFDTTIVTDAKMILPTLLTTPGFIHPVLGGLALAGVLAAILSTVGPVNFAVVTIATKDIYQGIIRKGAIDTELIATARRLVLIVNLITIPLAIASRGGILDAAYISYAIRAIGAIVIIMGLYARNWITSDAVKSAFIGGTLAILITVTAGALNLFTLDKTFVGVGSAVIFIIIGNLWTKYVRKEDNPSCCAE